MTNRLGFSRSRGSSSVSDPFGQPVSLSLKPFWNERVQYSVCPVRCDYFTEYPLFTNHCACALVGYITKTCYKHLKKTFYKITTSKKHTKFFLALERAFSYLFKDVLAIIHKMLLFLKTDSNFVSNTVNKLPRNNLKLRKNKTVTANRFSMAFVRQMQGGYVYLQQRGNV